jgi:hypothetical protein
MLMSTDAHCKQIGMLIWEYLNLFLNLMEMNFAWNNVWEELIVNYMIAKWFGKKVNSHLKSHENQFCVD